MPEITHDLSGDEVMMLRDRSEIQKIIYEQWLDVARKVKETRRIREQVVWIMNGDAVEGDHHNTPQLVTKYLSHQAYMHIQSVKEARALMGWKKTDRALYVAGTPIHVGEWERLAADALRAEFHPIIKMNTPAGQLWVTHYGASGGRGANAGNALTNRIRDELVTALTHGKTPPRFVVYSHHHTKRHRQIELGNHKVDGWILPSFQYKTSFGYRVAPFEPEHIGGLIMKINRDGTWSYKWETLEREEIIL
jgi:hypothetical protein